MVCNWTTNRPGEKGLLRHGSPLLHPKIRGEGGDSRVDPQTTVYNVMTKFIVNNRTRLDYQPLFGKGARAPPPKAQ